MTARRASAEVEPPAVGRREALDASRPAWWDLRIDELFVGHCEVPFGRPVAFVGRQTKPMPGISVGTAYRSPVDQPRAHAALGSQPIRTINRDELRDKLARGDDFRLVMALNRWAFDAKHIPGSLH